MSLNPIKVVIAEDHAIFRSSLILALNYHKSGIEIIGEAENGQQLVTLTEILQPDVVLTDIQMPIMDGLQAMKLIKTSSPHIRFVALTLLGDASIVKEMCKCGVDSYLLKNANVEDIIRVIHLVAEGGSYFDKDIACYIN